jgi:hypothetical protein
VQDDLADNVSFFDPVMGYGHLFQRKNLGLQRQGPCIDRRILWLTAGVKATNVIPNNRVNKELR